MRIRLLAALLAGVALLAACGGGDGGGGDGTIEGTDVAVEMYDNRFQYTEIRIPVGGSVKWVGAGRNPHNSVAADDSWSTESVFGSLEQLEDDEAVLTYNTPGRFTFFCTFHGNADGAGMAGVLIVGDA
ncbi:MAG: plastocyanin/azurin family copper-binding protein [Actinomycetota bacterium]|nr:plastocyanin/azurin family copper-binding protein [Actinomycetota bacterium]